MAKRYLLDIQAGSMCTQSSSTARGWPGPQKQRPCSFDKLTTAAFKRKLIRMADRLGLNPSMLAAVMMFETAGTMRADIQNSIRATGLIQFVPPTAVRLGTTVDALKKLTPEQQLDWVEKFFKNQAPRIKSLEDHYLAVFMPAYVGMSPSAVLGKSGSTETIGNLTKGAVYSSNKGFDKTGKGYFTVADVGATVVNVYRAAEPRPQIAVEMNPLPLPSVGTIVSLLVGAAAGYGVAWGVRELRQ